MIRSHRILLQALWQQRSGAHPRLEGSKHRQPSYCRRLVQRRDKDGLLRPTARQRCTGRGSGVGQQWSCKLHQERELECGLHQPERQSERGREQGPTDDECDVILIL